jgi:hypothetical protein
MNKKIHNFGTGIQKEKALKTESRAEQWKLGQIEFHFILHSAGSVAGRYCRGIEPSDPKEQNKLEEHIVESGSNMAKSILIYGWLPWLKMLLL